MKNINNISLWKTKLRYIGQNKLMQLFPEPYVIIAFARNTNDDLFFVVDLLQKVSDQEGVTGLHCYLFNEQELCENFEEI